MKIGKVLGVTSLVTGTVVFGTWVYNEMRWEKWEKQFFQEYYENSKSMKDSIKAQGQMKKAYFEGSQLICDSIQNVNLKDTAKTVVKKLK